MLLSRQWLDQLTALDEKDISSSDDGMRLVSEHSTLKQEMSSAYILVSEEGKNLLSALQKPCNDERSAKARSRVSDYSEAVSHVMEIILQIHEQNRQLTILWEKQRARLSQKFKLCQLQNDSDEVWSAISDKDFIDIHYALLEAIFLATRTVCALGCLKSNRAVSDKTVEL